jgi:ariadne-1
MKVWKGHDDFYSCGRYEKAEKKRQKQSGKSKKQSKLQAQEQEREQKRVALERYIKFYDKYLEYDNQVKNSQLRDKAHALIQQLQTEQTTLTEVKFIEKATDVLLECYGSIKYSYVYAFFLDDSSTEKEIFSLHQENMIQTCGQMKTILESPASTILQRRTEVVDLTKLAAKRKTNLIETEVTGSL